MVLTAPCQDVRRPYVTYRPATSLFFRKGRQMLGVIINRSGGTFTLVGS